MKRMRFTSVFLVFILMISSLGFSFAVPVQAEAGKAEQKTEVPEGYIGIYSAVDLDHIRNDLNGQYILMNDLDLSQVTKEGGELFNDGAGWNPIGSESAPFNGIFDGNGYTINGMNIHLTSEQTVHAGLFGYAKDADIRNLGMTDIVVRAENTSLESASSNAYAGGVVGYGYNITITDVNSSGKVDSQSLFKSYAGGIAGYIESDYRTTSTITNVLNSGQINSKSYTGGIAGEIYRTTVSHATNEGDINHSQNHGKYAGGIAGNVNRDSSIQESVNSGHILYGDYGGGIAGSISYSSIKNSYNTGNLDSSISFAIGGGIAGRVSASNISQTHNAGKVTGTADYSDSGGIAGEAGSNSSIVKSYNLGEIVADTTSGGIVGTLSSSVVAQSYNNAETNGHYAGGIGGWLSGSSITDSFNIGTVFGSYDSGGLAGHVTNSTIQNSYNAGNVKGSFDSGGIAGEFDGTISNAFYLDQSYKGVDNGSDSGTVKVSLEELRIQETFSGFDFQTKWTMEQNTEFLFPELIGNEIAGEEKAVKLLLKSAPDKVSYIQGEELDLTGSVITIATNFGNIRDVVVQPEMISGFYKDIPGEQQVKITYHNLAVYFNVTVVEKDITPPDKPVVEDVTDQSAAITGMAEAQSTVEVKVKDELIGKGAADAQGNFTIDIPVQQAGTELVVTATDVSGNISEQTVIIVKDITPPSKPVVNQVTDQDEFVTGEAEPETVVKVFAYNILIGSGTTSSDGKFKVSIPVQAAGVELLVGVLDRSDNPSEQVTLVVKDVTPPEKAKVNSVTDRDHSISGEGEAGSTVEVQTGGTIIGTETVWASGEFRVNIPEQKEGTELAIVLVDGAGNRSEAAFITVGDGTAPERPVVNEINDLTKAITGNAEPGAVVKASTNGQAIGQGAANEDGSFRVEIPLQRPGTEIMVTATDDSGNVSEGTYIQVADITVPVKPTVYTVTDQDSVVKGVAEAGTYIEISVDTWIIGRGTAEESGEFSISISPQKAGTRLVITSSDAYGHMSEEASIIIQDSDLKGWIKKDNGWYYYDSISGEMARGWLKSGGKWYYMNEYGVMQTGWEKIAGKWYFLNSGGDMRIGWLKSGAKWYYLDGSGAMRTGWLQTSGVWYYFEGSGAMKTGWLQSGGKWYYMASSGAMQTGWIQSGGKWYYLYSNGSMAYNTIIDGYKLGADGAWV